jgi:peroxiredoxin
MHLRISRSVIPAAIILLLTLSAATTLMAALSAGDRAPVFSLPAVGSRSLSLDQIRKNPAEKGVSRVVVLDFWATWCPYCVKEVPGLQKIYQAFAGKGVTIVGISRDSGGVNDVKPFVQKNRITYTQLIDSEMKVSRLYGVTGIPTTFVIDRSGIIRFIHIGYEPGMEKELQSEIRSLLK